VLAWGTNVGQGQGDSISKEVVDIDVVNLNWASHSVGHVGVHLAVVDDQGHLIEAEAEAEGPEDLSQSHQKPDKAGARSCFGGWRRFESSREWSGTQTVSANEWRIFCIKLHACQ
jgi:hypothetical protein